MRTKASRFLFITLTTVLLLSGCAPLRIADSQPISTSLSATPASPRLTATPTASSVATVTLSPTATQTPTPTETETPVPLPTLNRLQSGGRIREQLRGELDCAPPCFLGILPGETSLSEALDILSYMGIVPSVYPQDDGSTSYSFETYYVTGLEFTAYLTVADEMVKNIRIKLSPEEQKAGVPREWLAYSPETMIHRYGVPSRVDFFLGRGAHATPFSIEIYFDHADTIIEYWIDTLGGKRRICPLQEQFGSVSVWMGKDPVHPPLPGGEPLEKTTSMTLESFAEMMLGDPEKACFDLIVENFP